MHYFKASACVFVLCTAIVQAQSLLDALVAANASAFADFLQTNPDSLAALQAPGIQTVFAPTDDAIRDYANQSSSSSLRVRQALSFQAQYQASLNLESISNMANPPGEVVPTRLGTGSRDQVVVAQPRPPVPRNESSLVRRQQASNSTVEIFSGLGNTVNILQGDIPFSGGVIHLVDSIFTVPQSFASTFGQTGLTSFASGLNSLNSTNMSSAMNSATGVTIFSFSNDVFSAGLGNSTQSQLSSTLSSHIVPDFLGFLPALTDGQVLRTQAGTSLTVSIRNGDYFINNARIMTPNLITDAGVSHILDQVIVPSYIAIGDASTSTWNIAALLLPMFVGILVV